MGNQTSVGWVSTASLDDNEIVETWISSWNQFYKDFTDTDLRLSLNETRDDLFRKEIKTHLSSVLTRRFLMYTTNKIMSFAVVADKGEFIQVYGIALKPYSILNLRHCALAMFHRLQEDYPDKELRGMLRAISDRGVKLYKYMGAQKCTDWHDEEYDENHIPLRISSTAALKAAKVATNKTTIDIDEEKNDNQ